MPNGDSIKISLVIQRVGEFFVSGWWVGESVIGRLVKDLLVIQWSVVGGRWVGGGPVGDSVVGGSVEHLPVAQWSVVGVRWPVGGW